MRWDALFADLEAQLRAGHVAGHASEAADRQRGEQAAVALADRVRAHAGATLRLRLRDGTAVEGTVGDAAVEWVVLHDGPTQVLVPWTGVVSVAGLSRLSAPPAGQVLARLGLRHALRALARDRAAVRLHTDHGEVTGTIDRVGADHVDVAEHALGEARRPGAVRAVRTVRTAALLAVRSA
ncbi:MAG TPA: Fis family transcriptional regulator [Actinomycetales bacterium]|nr:Fis family transcriptional regulator [Actinomycetales bacterium]